MVITEKPVIICERNKCILYAGTAVKLCAWKTTQLFFCELCLQGAALIRMLANFMGHSVFQMGLQVCRNHSFFSCVLVLVFVSVYILLHIFLPVFETPAVALSICLSLNVIGKIGCITGKAVTL